MKQLTIAIDFDNCITKPSVWPNIGDLRPVAKIVIKKLYEEGHTVIINSCRVEDFAIKARSFLDRHYVPYHYFNENNKRLINLYGGDTRKISADIYMDDKNAGGMPTWKDFYNHCQFEAKPIILCIVGESGSGKSMMADYLESKYGIPMIESHTTRAKRTPDETGHAFVSDEEFNQFKKEDMIAFTKYGDDRYCCLKSAVSDLCSYVISEDGLIHLQKNENYNVIAVRKYRDHGAIAECTDPERVARDKGRYNLMLEDFDFVINGHKYKSTVYESIDAMVDHILVYKKNFFGEKLF